MRPGLDTVLGVVLERVSHCLRTPLGVALSVVSDQASGMKCTLEDFEDAARALKRMQDMLTLLRDAAAACGKGESDALSAAERAFQLCPWVRRDDGERSGRFLLAVDGPAWQSAGSDFLGSALADSRLEALPLVVGAAILNERGITLRAERKGDLFVLEFRANR